MFKARARTPWSSTAAAIYRLGDEQPKKLFQAKTHSQNAQQEEKAEEYQKTNKLK